MTRVPYLESLRAKGIHPDFYDPEGVKHPLPTYPWKFAPPGFSTRRQLRAKGLRPAGQDVAAQIIWRHHDGHRIAYLYDELLCQPKRQATPAQLAAIEKALNARKTCPSCGITYPYCLPKSLGECVSCHEGARRDLEREAS